MYVCPDSYVFANNHVVFINQQLELNAASSNFYLRTDAQFFHGSGLQRTDSQSKNNGLGSLSVFPEGTTNNYQFDYWCSLVGGSNAIAGNSAFGITQLKDIVDVTNSANSTPLAMNNYNGTASPFALAPYWIFELTASSNYLDCIQVGTTSNIDAGEGFTMKGSSGTNLTTVNGVQNNPRGIQRFDFREKPNTGTIFIPVAFEQFRLTGNPHSSAIDVSAFLIEQTHCAGIAYF